MLLNDSAVGPRKPMPAWAAFLKQRNESARAEMPPTMRAEYEAACAAARDRRERQKLAKIERKKNAAELTRRLLDLLHDGLTGYEIAESVGRSVRTIRQFGAARGIVISRNRLIVRRAIPLATRNEGALRRAAEDRGTSAAETLEAAVACLLEDDASILRRHLHIKRRERIAA